MIRPVTSGQNCKRGHTNSQTTVPCSLSTTGLIHQDPFKFRENHPLTSYAEPVRLGYNIRPRPGSFNARKWPSKHSPPAISVPTWRWRTSTEPYRRQSSPRLRRRPVSEFWIFCGGRGVMYDYRQSRQAKTTGWKQFILGIRNACRNFFQFLSIIEKVTPCEEPMKMRLSLLRRFRGQMSE